MLKLTYSNIGCLKLSGPHGGGGRREGYRRGGDRTGYGERREGGKGRGGGGREGKEGEKGRRKGKGKKVPPIFQTKFTSMHFNIN